MDIVERLRSNQPLPICPYDRKSPEYWTTPDDAPCKFCGGLPDGPDKCTGADTRVMGEAADEIQKLREAVKPLANLELPKQTTGNAGAYSIRHKDIAAARAALSIEEPK